MAEETVSCPVKIHMTTEIFQEEAEKIELVLFGHYYEKGGSAYLKYEEMQEAGKIHTVVKMVSGRALVMRSGAVSMRLDLREGSRRPGTYENGYGQFPIEAAADEIVHTRTGSLSGQFSLGYRLYMHGDSVGTYKMKIHYEEVQAAK
ncbi:DUF1934 domain-containing protein [Heyndrickxia coagulans]|uniref:DUF1934 domain-containing protein n=1 Tax=Heyndrickxia coagulans TaxID=1398 RepID=UPI0023E3A0C6|nr:DUF1934 domain-containing protein [Heyndrickxia coagulans]